MKAVLLSVHVLAAIIFIGPVTVAASLFPRYARLAADGEPGARGVVELLHRISRVYAVVGVSVPVFGLALAGQMKVMGDPWLIISIVLTVLAAALLAVVILPAQTRVVEPLRAGAAAPPVSSRLSMASGIFALTWAVVVVLMIVRPGSTTGV